MTRRAAVGLLLAVAAAGCARPGAATDGVRVTMEVAPQPPVAGAARVEIRLSDADGAPLAATAVELEGTMAHAGMAPTFATARPLAPGRWVAELELTMGGDWYVVVDARLADGRAVRRTLPLPGVEPP